MHYLKYEMTPAPISSREGGICDVPVCCVAVGKSDVEFQTPAVSEKFQSRFGWKPQRAESETGPGSKTTDNMEGETET